MNMKLRHNRIFEKVNCFSVIGEKISNSGRSAFGPNEKNHMKSKAEQPMKGQVRTSCCRRPTITVLRDMTDLWRYTAQLLLHSTQCVNFVCLLSQRIALSAQKLSSIPPLVSDKAKRYRGQVTDFA